MKKWMVTAWIGFLAFAIMALFWHNEWVYSLPTPVPANYKAVAANTAINMANRLKLGHDKPLFLHFFNPGCPCSKFNIKHFKSLVQQYGKQATFAMVVIGTDKDVTAKGIQDNYNLQIPIYFDTTIATLCGVYSTPQAAIIDTQNKLCYRGNYNKSRYCTDKNTNYAQMALEALLNKQKQPIFNRVALQAYGCQLPKCTK